MWIKDSKVKKRERNPLKIVLISILYSRSASGAASKCDNCGHVTYPVTAPVGIVSIGNESNDKLLLIRQPRQAELEGEKNIVWN